MIVDLCRPLNAGEALTVRIIMTVDEARDSLATLRGIGTDEHDLLRGLRCALSRNERAPDGRATP
jgi:hypothetical protein